MTGSFPHLIPRQPVPDLRVPLVGGRSYNVRAEKPPAFSLIVFYRGLHCPICKTQLKDLEARLGEFEHRGVSVVAISTDNEERASQTSPTWQLPQLRIGYDLSLPVAREWGLYISRGRGKTSTGVDKPDLFSEPAIYLVRPDGTLYFGSVQTMPFARPHFADILGAIDYVVKNDYPARGEVDRTVEHAEAS
ncbi:peroxiredoxin-like family protein [Mesorhizobium sp. ORS 3428]|uniref:peroxiredoxin-like family protein n=1 Tax=Mesorhizobium sp. ORS 3428 TaxID=540997 RepID=UPI0008DA29E1|nr:peroxiredoxin-like family protein [Mesorhizobium sp. ORS 3428]OHV88007.1 alkyl hydroperoxide reductase [Mesorhizobium sp. ORS 3428]